MIEEVAAHQSVFVTASKSSPSFSALQIRKVNEGEILEIPCSFSILKKVTLLTPGIVLFLDNDI